MGEVVSGAYIEILAELAEVPFVLGRDLLGDELLGPGETMADITHEAWHVRSRRGTSDPYGPLTKVRSGQLVVDLWDPSRRYDPQRENGGRITFGAAVELRVDGEPAFVGRLEAIDHTYMDRTSVLTVGDGVSRLQAHTLPLDDGLGVGIAAGSTFDQLGAVLDELDIAADQRILYGSPTAFRLDIDPDTLQAWAWLQSIALAELGDLWVDRYGRIAFRGRHAAPDGTIRATIGAQGIACDGLFVQHERRAYVSGVNLTMLDGDRRSFADTAAEATHGERRISVSEDELRLDTPT